MVLTTKRFSDKMVSYTDNKGSVKPIIFRMEIGDEPMQVIKVDKVIIKETGKLAGNIMIAYKCQCLIDDTIKLYEIKYEISTCR